MRVVSINDGVSHLKGLTVLVRTALNVPLINGVVSNAFRLDAALPTIELLLHAGARVILVSHSNAAPSLKPVFEYLRNKIPLTMADDVVGTTARGAVKALEPGHALLLENVRRDRGEETNDEHFARVLASLADVFVNDDFPAAHRAHASVVGVPKFLPSYAGLQFLKELDGLSIALDPKSPSLAILGGAKFVTKEPLIRALLKTYDTVFVGGALANDFFKARGYAVGRSLVSLAPHLDNLLKNSKLMLPVDVTIDGPNGRDVRDVADVLETETIYDLGPRSIQSLEPLLAKARVVLWNGPLGNFEKGFTEYTELLAARIAEAPGISVVGGGDTIASIQKLGLNDRFEFVSTAGGAMLDFLAHGTLPGIEALKNARKLS